MRVDDRGGGCTGVGAWSLASYGKMVMAGTCKALTGCLACCMLHRPASSCILKGFKIINDFALNRSRSVDFPLRTRYHSLELTGKALQKPGLVVKSLLTSPKSKFNHQYICAHVPEKPNATADADRTAIKANIMLMKAHQHNHPNPRPQI